MQRLNTTVVGNTCLVWNCNSLSLDKQSQLDDLINPHTSPLSAAPAVIALCEVRLRLVDGPVPKLFGYSWVSASSVNTPGCGFFVHSSLPHRMHNAQLHRPSVPDLRVMDVCWLQVRLPQALSDILIACVYLNTNHPDFDHARHWGVLEQCLDSGRQTGRDLLVVGDFNAQHTILGARKDSASGVRLLTVVNHLGLTCLNAVYSPGVVTRPSISALDGGGTTIDLAFTSSTGIISGLRVGNHSNISHSDTVDLESDHLPLWVHFAGHQNRSGSTAAERQTSAPKWRCTQASEADWSAYTTLLQLHLSGVRDELIQKLSTHCLSPSESAAENTIQLCWGRIRDLIVATGDATIGRKGSRDGQVPHLDALWRQSGVVDAVKVLQRARRRYNHYPNCPDTRQEYYDAKYQWKRVKNAARQSVWVETCQSIQRDKKDPARMWRNFGVTVPREYVPLINVMPNGALDLPGSATEGIQATAQYFAEVCSEHKVDQPLPIHSC